MRRMQQILIVIVLLVVAISMVPQSTATASGPTYVVQRGDTLYSIAVRHNTTVEALMRWNGLPSTHIYVGQRLVVGPGGQPESSGGNTYVVQSGDTLYSIARKFGVSVQRLAQANNTTINSWVYAGQKLRIPAGAPSDSPPPTAPSGSQGNYTVRPGDSLIAIAYRHGVSLGALAQLNGLRVDSWVYVGQKLKVPGQAYTPEQPPRQQPRYGDGYYHIVRPGETVTHIAQQYGVPIRQIAQANRITNPSRIYAGQRLMIPGYSPKPAPKPKETTPTSTKPPYVAPETPKPKPSQPKPAAPKPPTVVNVWQGEVVESDCTQEDTLEFRSILRINVEGRTNQPIDIYALPVQSTTFVTWIKTGTKPELGDTGAEVAPLKAGHYAIIPAGLDTQLNIWVDGRCTVYVNFRQVSKAS